MFCCLAAPPGRAQLHSSAIGGYGTSVCNSPPQPPDYCANTAVDFRAAPPANVTEQHLLKSSLLVDIRDLRGRVVESTGIRSYRERSGPGRWHNRPGVDGVVADKAQTHCPRLERLVPKVLKNRKCLDTYELLNSSFSRRHVTCPKPASK